MRFTRKHFDREHRITRFFAWFPCALRYEVRWLETVYIHQIYHINHKAWLDVEWTDKDHYKLYKAGLIFINGKAIGE